MSQTSITSWFKSAAGGSKAPNNESTYPTFPQVTTSAPPPLPTTKLVPPPGPATVRVPPLPQSPLAPPLRSPGAPLTTAPQQSYFLNNSTTAHTTSPSKVKINDNVELRPITIDDITALRRILSLRLPIQYPDSFYKPLTSAHNSRHSRLIVWVEKDKPDTIIGTLICRIETRPPDNVRALYLQALCLLSPYQGLGLMSKAIDFALAAARDQDGVTIADAHVWTASEDTIEWYQRRGFVKSAVPLKQYYQKLQPRSAWIMTRQTDTAPRTPGPISGSSTTPAVGGSTLAAAANLPAFSASPSSSTTSLTPSATGQSFQNAAPPMSWNDLPEDMASLGTKSKSGISSRKKRDRSYPAHAY